MIQMNLQNTWLHKFLTQEFGLQASKPLKPKYEEVSMPQNSKIVSWCYWKKIFVIKCVLSFLSYMKDFLPNTALSSSNSQNEGKVK